MSLIRRIIEGFNAAEVSYVVVGGIAVLVHGRSRLTVDLDVILSFDEQNVRRALGVLAAERLVPRLPVRAEDFADPKIREHWVKDRNMMVFSFIDPTNSLAGVDLFATHLIDFVSLMSDSIVGQFDGTPVRCCSIDHLIALKKIAHRAIDRADIEELEIIRDVRNRKTD